MLASLTIRDILLIDRADIAFRPGLNVLTGETGAGKSILLDSLGFVLGWRGRSDLVRPGAGEGEVVAEFLLEEGHPALAVLAEAGLPADDTLVLRRVNQPDGRKRAWVNDRPASGEVLRALSDVLVELHGQHDDRGLLDPRGHRALLDAFAGAEAARAGTRNAWTALRRARTALSEAEETLEKAAVDAEFLTHAVAELDKLDPQPGEDHSLSERRRLMQNAARIGEDIARAGQSLSAEGAESMVADAMRRLESVAEGAEGRLDPVIESLGRALDALGEAQAGISSTLHELEFNPYELEQAEERLFAIRAMARKHRVQPDELPALRESLSARLVALDSGARGLAPLRDAVAQAEADFDQASIVLGALRRQAARRLDTAMAAELGPLKLGHARFVTEVSDAQPGPEGRDAISFAVATIPGAPPGPVGRIASGGELSRFLLALKVCLSGGARGLTMIFDEIDRGVGGATADAVGRRLAVVAQGAQVLAVTHSPQVAARAAHHLLVSKTLSGTGASTAVSVLPEAGRIDELARMLAGDVVTEAARAAARALLADENPS